MTIRVSVPTKDRPGNVALALSQLALGLKEGEQLYLYDDGDRPATADYAARFALDLAMTRGVEVVVKRGKPAGIAKARARMIRDAARDDIEVLVMVDDDILLEPRTLERLCAMFDDDTELQYTVPIIGLANNEAGVGRFGAVDEATSTHDQQFVMGDSGVVPMKGGAWTCAIALNLDRVNADVIAQNLHDGPAVVEDYVLTRDLRGACDRGEIAWHVMTPEQGLRDWNGKALAYLREQLG